MNRRSFLSGLLGAAAATPAVAAVGSGAPMLRGTLDDAGRGLITGSTGDRSVVLQNLLNEASAADRQIFLPPGDYVISEINLPSRTRLAGVPGATRLVFGGGAHMIAANDAKTISLSGLVIDGASRPLDEYVPGLVHLSGCADVRIDDCVIERSSRSGLALDRSAGSIRHTTIRDAAMAGVRAVESTGLTIADNTIADCGNGGILVYRWTEGEDGTLVSGNRIERIRADAGGTGQNGNGINVFRAGSVIVANNRIADCAFTAVRANSASDVQITGNNCVRSGEMAIYSEFAFQGAIIANNLIDDAAAGISVTNFADGGRLATVTGNVVRNLRAEGPYPGRFGGGILVEADTAVTGNVIENAAGPGLQLGYGPYLRDVSVTGNVIRDAEIGIAVSVVEGVGPAVISGNLISGARRGAIIGMRWQEYASGDLARSGAKAFRHLQIDRNQVS